MGRCRLTTSSSSPTLNWQSTEGALPRQCRIGPGGGGSWTPTARLNGRALETSNLQLTSNGALARFAASINLTQRRRAGHYTLPSAGKTTNTQNGCSPCGPAVGTADGVAPYEADPVTGAVVGSKGHTFKPARSALPQRCPGQRKANSAWSAKPARHCQPSPRPPNAPICHWTSTATTGHC